MVSTVMTRPATMPTASLSRTTATRARTTQATSLRPSVPSAVWLMGLSVPPAMNAASRVGRAQATREAPGRVAGRGPGAGGGGGGGAGVVEPAAGQPVAADDGVGAVRGGGGDQDQPPDGRA